MDNKDKLKEWNIKFVNCMGQVDPQYEKALTCLMKWADAEVMPDMESGWPGDSGFFDEVPELNSRQLDKDLKTVLIEKAVGTVHTKVVNGMPKGGVYVYTDIYKWFTETSGLGLMEQVRKLMHPEVVKKESDTTTRVEEWVEKCDRLAKYGTQYELPAFFKTAALQQMLIGETRRSFDTWKIDGLPYEKLLVKLKEYALSQRLDGEAARGKQAVDMNRTTRWSDEEDPSLAAEDPEKTEEELKALANVECSLL